MKYTMIDEDRTDFIDELNKLAKKGLRPIWETYRQYPQREYSNGEVRTNEQCSLILEDPEGQTTLRKPKRK
jgi:hypothetical protein